MTHVRARTFDVFIRTQGGKSEAEQRNVFVGSSEAEIPSAMKLRGLKDKNFGMPEFLRELAREFCSTNFKHALHTRGGKEINEAPDQFSIAFDQHLPETRQTVPLISPKANTPFSYAWKMIDQECQLSVKSSVQVWIRVWCTWSLKFLSAGSPPISKQFFSF